MQEPIGVLLDQLGAHLTVEADDARHFLSTYMLATVGAEDAWPVLVPCKADGVDAPLVLGLRRDNRGVVSYRLPLMDSTPTSKSSAPSLTQLLERYHAVIPPGLPRGAPKQRISAIYDIIGAADEPSMSSVALMFEWTETPKTFSPPPYSASSLMKARVLPGDPKSPASWLYADMKQLDTFAACAASETPESETGWGGAGTEEIRDTVASFIAEVVADGGRPPTVAAPALDGACRGTNAGKITPRSDLDFTERLWGLCKGAASFDDLRKSLAQVFRALQTGQIQPMVHRSNNSTIANVARQCLLQTSDPAIATQLRESMQRLSDPVALVSAVVEIGLTKLRRDYAAYFVGEELSTGQQLEHFLSDSVPLSERVLRLHHLHEVLELVVTVKAYCDVPHTSIRKLFMNALQQYRKTPPATIDGTDAPTFELQFPSFSESASQVKRMCAEMDPSKWTVELFDDARPHDRITTVFSTTLETYGVTVTETADALGFSPFDDGNETCYYSTTMEMRHTGL